MNAKEYFLSLGYTFTSDEQNSLIFSKSVCKKVDAVMNGIYYSVPGALTERIVFDLSSDVVTISKRWEPESLQDIGNDLMDELGHLIAGDEIEMQRNSLIAMVSVFAEMDGYLV